jgi:hypothetical protein
MQVSLSSVGNESVASVVRCRLSSFRCLLVRKLFYFKVFAVYPVRVVSFVRFDGRDSCVMCGIKGFREVGELSVGGKIVCLSDIIIIARVSWWWMSQGLFCEWIFRARAASCARCVTRLIDK